MAATAASASVYLCNNSRFPFPSLSNCSKTQNLSLKPVSIRPFSVPVSKSFNCVIKSSSKRFHFPIASLSGQESAPKTKTDDEYETTQAIPDMKAVMLAYKQAILVGDAKVVSDIEVMICTIEKEKNELVENVSGLSAEVRSGKDKYTRLQADFDNFRKRSEKERLTVRTDAQGEVIESLLPMVDNFERAKQQLKLETDQEKKIDASYQGIYKQFVEIMRSLHVAVVPTVGKPFDPSLHEAIAREESQEFPEGIITQEFRRGFFLGSRLLRPAMVKVSSGPGRLEPSPKSDEPAEQTARAER